MSFSFILPNGALCFLFSFSLYTHAESVSLKDAIRLTLTQHPELQAASAHLRAAEAETRQAKVRPNPELEVSTSEVDRNDDGLEGAELEVMLVQPLEWGGERRVRKERATVQLRLASIERQVREIQLTEEVRMRYADAHHAQTSLHFMQQRQELTQAAYQAVLEKVEAGKAAPPRLTRITVLQEEGQLALAEAERTLIISKRALTGMWSREPLDIELQAPEQVVEDLSAPESWEHHPEIQRIEAARSLAELQVAEVKAEQIPDPFLAAGVQHFREDDTTGYHIGVGVELPLWNRRTGAKAAAVAQVEVVEAEREVLLREIALDWEEAVMVATNARQREHTYRETLVPSAEKAFSFSQTAYKEGREELLDLLDARQTLIRVKQNWADAQRTLAHATATLHTLRASVQN